MHNRRPRHRRIAALLLSALGAFVAPSNAEPKPAAAPADPGYMRVMPVGEDGLELEIGARKLVPRSGKGPVIWLAGAVHVGDQTYYNAVQRFLNAQTLVLFEGVGRPPFAESGPADDPTMTRRTQSALHYTGSLVAWYHNRFHVYPLSLAVLRQAVREQHRRESLWIQRAMMDAWDKPLVYHRPAEGNDDFQLMSLGSDNKPGGEGAAADVVFTEYSSPQQVAAMEDAGIQGQLASALGLVFQLDAIDYGQPNFRNSDMSMHRLQDLMAGRKDPKPAGAPGDVDDDPPVSPEASQQMQQMMKLLDGSSAMASVLKFGLRLIGSSPKMQSMVKLVMIDMLGSIQGDLSNMKGLPPEMNQLMKVLIQDRNAIVVADLKRIIAEPDAPRSIAVFYGAGHMADLQKRIADELDYVPGTESGDSFWLTAFKATAAEAGMSGDDLKLVRGMVKAQLKMMTGP
jgi:hypothetical protein